MDKKQKVELFLKELEELTEKYSIRIEGCGCCGSPYLLDLEGRVLEDNLEYFDGKYKLDYNREQTNYCK